MARDPVKVSKNLDDNALGNALFTSISDGTDLLLVNGDGSLNATINNASIEVTATNLDIRDLTHVSDSVKVGDGTDFLAIAADGSIAVTDNGSSLTVDAVNLDIRDLTSASDSVSVLQTTHDNLNLNANLQVGDADVANGNPVPVSDAGGSLTVDANNLDIRDLTHATDSVKVGDGTDFLAVNADGSINVVVGASAGTAVVDYNENATLATLTSSNHDYTASGGAFQPSKVLVSSESIATFEIRTGPTGSLITRGKVRTSVENPNAEFTFQAGFSIADTEVVRVIRTNDSNKTHAVNSTIEGTQL